MLGLKLITMKANINADKHALFKAVIVDAYNVIEAIVTVENDIEDHCTDDETLWRVFYCRK